MTYPSMVSRIVTRDLATGMILAKIALNHSAAEAFYCDPITEAYGLGSEMGWVYDKTERRLYGELLTRSRKTGERHVEEFALAMLEQWMP